MSAIISVHVPFENVNDDRARLTAWEVRTGQCVREGEPLCKLETAKVVYEVAAPGAGVVELVAEEGLEFPVGTLLCRIHPAGGTLPEPAIPGSDAPSPAIDQDGRNRAPESSPSTTGDPALFSRKARILLAELALSPDLFSGCGVVGEADVRAMAERQGLGPRAATTTPLPPPRSASLDFEEIVPLERPKVYENRELAAANSAVLRSTLHVACPAADLSQAGTRTNPPVSRLAILLFELAQALRHHRRLNATHTSGGIGIYRYINLGFAVDMGHGLKVLVVRQADQLDLAAMQQESERLLVHYLTESLQPADVTGSTFTLTDLSGDGVVAFEPLINHHQAAILGVGASIPFTGDKAASILSCAFDHRILSGRDVAAFLRDLSGRLGAYEASAGRDHTTAEDPCCSNCLRSAAELRHLSIALVSSVEPKGYICAVCLIGS